jgi:hypothetical protein
LQEDHENNRAEEIRMVFEFPREEVLVSIRKNREDHLAELQEALDGWRGDLIEAIDAERATLAGLRKRAKAGRLRPRDMRYDILGVRSPESHETDYAVAIRMLEMASTEAVSLTESDFARYVLDRWDWRGQFDDYLAEVRYKQHRVRPPRRRA